MSANSLPIPRLIHQTWKTRDLPAHLLRWHESIRVCNPDWEVRVWSDEDNRALISQHFPWFLPTYDNYPLAIMRVDAVRPFLLYQYGGVYADLDVECLSSFDRLRSGAVDADLVRHRPSAEVGLVFALERRITRSAVCSNAIMASRPGHPIWPHVFRSLQVRAQRAWPWFMPRENYVLTTTGPEVLDEMFREHASEFDDALVVEPEVLCPLGWWQGGNSRQFPRSIAVHRYGSSWMGAHSVAWQRLLRGLAG
jgi:mannosyltransferase OCH1-like enzyme